MKNKILFSITTMATLLIFICMAGVEDMNGEFQPISFIVLMISLLWCSVFFNVNQQYFERMGR